MRMERIYGVETRIIKAEHDVPLHAIFVLDEQIRDGGAVWDELGADTLSRDLVLAARIGSEGSFVAAAELLAQSRARAGEGRKRDRELGEKHGAWDSQLATRLVGRRLKLWGWGR